MFDRRGEELGQHHIKQVYGLLSEERIIVIVCYLSMERLKYSICILILLSLGVPAEGEVFRFIAPSEPQTLHFEFKYYTESDRGLSEINLMILPYQAQTDTESFIACLRGPGVGCVPTVNTLPACWVKASNGAWIEQLFCTDFTRFEQFNSYLGLDPESTEVPDFVVWTCHGITPAQFANCQKFDFDADNDVDLDDFASYQNQYLPPLPSSE